MSYVRVLVDYLDKEIDKLDGYVVTWAASTNENQRRAAPEVHAFAHSFRTEFEVYFNEDYYDHELYCVAEFLDIFFIDKIEDFENI